MDITGTNHISVPDVCKNGLFYQTKSVSWCYLSTDEDIFLWKLNSGQVTSQRSYCLQIFLLQAEKDAVEVEAANMISTVLRIENIGPILLCLLTGPLSDKHGRKIPLILSCAGMTACYAGWLD